MKIPDQFRSQVIEQLKLLSEDQCNVNILLSSIAIARLSECKENHTDIISGNFPNILRKLISSDYLRIIDQGMMLALNLLHLGTDETRIKVNEGVPSYAVVGLLQSRDQQIALTAQLLDQWLLSIL
ncbi:MAG: hypothetical protein EZS28_035181 [Streblomastix strix]|uniref:Uncharacterized protein n=1 Tax=Streblomastix strix TaxID=222440 RepID=A0A5J4UH94_9EUKA|nr:MAG: hypothetical protein EZS28_035181 [Streblomastix strix]